ncbi:hypothetical protein SAMN05421837_119105 [Amycolatopsis pretoriensis]|uniref:Secreted protein n=1 Tax=Amycolatopsis pretoriensis TaxID=218821 RepID=A0A1H5RL76_9PSEU|nr:hypothetical protein [Amycolatopsis pretoriensis]SEF38271.1 hypothetical protein SAMN05421837_119105 [Amycolatopsis pretoriensis]
MPATGGRHRLSRRTKIATAALGLALAAGALVIATTVGDPGAANAAGVVSGGQITCPDVASKLPAIPASAQAEVQRNLDLLNTQIAEANNRLVSTVGQGGPNFVQNAILGPLKDKRVSTIDRIAIAIGRQGQKPQGLDSLAACSQGGQANTGAGAVSTAPAQNGGTAGNTGNTGNTGNAAGQIACPDVASQLPAIPASAQAEVQRNLDLLNTQIAEANNRLVSTVGQGGPNFVQNAILGPLEDKRVATINRIATAIGRTAEKPQGLDALAPCSR